MSEPVMQRLKISREGIILIKSFEGFRPRAVRREDGQWVIGYGHTLSAREGASVSEADAELLLQYDLLPVAQAVNDGVAEGANGAINQHQFDALASFAFSIGVERFRASDVLSRLVAGSAGEAADALVNWPETNLPEASLRRRAAERALFVADPAWPVALSDLLSAPLPLPLAEPEPEAAAEPAAPEALGEADILPDTPAAAPLADADSSPAIVAQDPPADIDASRQAAVATLLGEGAAPAVPVEADEPASGDPAVPAVPAAPADPAATEPEDASDADTSTESVAPVTIAATRSDDVIVMRPVETFADTGPMVFDPASAPEPLAFNASSRFSPYAAPIVGPLTLAEADPEPAIPASLEPVAEPSPFPGLEPIAPVFPHPEPQPELAPEPVKTAPEAASSTTSDDGTGFPPLVEPQPAAPLETAEPVETTAPPPFEPAPIVPSWPTLTAETEPKADGALLVLTPLPEDSVFPAPRLVWPHGEGDETQSPPLFEDDGSLRLGGSPLSRPEPLDAFTPRRVAWGEMGAFLLMGGFGLVSFGMAMAAFRRASQSASGSNELTIIAIVLAVFGAACVGVSAYNLYRRWGREDAV